MNSEKAFGCTWIVGRMKRWDSVEKKYRQVPVHCNKLAVNGSEYCPKHLLMAQVQEEKPTTYAKGA